MHQAIDLNFNPRPGLCGNSELPIENTSMDLIDPRFSGCL